MERGHFKERPFRLRGRKRLTYYILVWMVPSAFAVIAFALIQHLIIQRVPLAEISPSIYLIPALVGSLFGLLMARGLEMQRELKWLNTNLEDQVAVRTRSLENQQALQRSLLDALPEIILLTNGARLTEANAALLDFFPEHADLEAFRSEHGCISQLFDEVDDPAALSPNDPDWVRRCADEPNRVHKAVIHRQGHRWVFDVNARALPSVEQDAYVISLTNITPLEQTRERLQEASAALRDQLYYDDLTGLPNRTCLLADLEKSNDPVLLLLNIDHFREINDFFGHAMGDAVLCEVAERLSASLPEGVGPLYRVGGDEYALLYAGNGHPDPPEQLAARLVDAVRATSFSGNTNAGVILGITVGVVGEGQKPLEPFTAADLALKTARSRHLDWFSYSEGLETHREYGENIRRVQVLREALDAGRVTPVYMPILDVKGGRITHYECLARLYSADGRVVLPGEFLTAAHTTRLYPRITIAMVDQACREFAERQEHFSLNLSMSDILNKRTVDTILETIERSGTGHRIIFEILESEGLREPEQFNHFMERARALGCRFAIDDFGAGFANFEYITRLEVDLLKIDASLIRGLGQGPAARVVVETICLFAHRLGIETVAEFVDTAEVLETVRSLGIDYAQGFHIGRPGSPPTAATDRQAHDGTSPTARSRVDR
ncbi:MAG: putative bifunctional diguanylate cyclase/phosphodiesterase [Pseudomonadota bacterium]